MYHNTLLDENLPTHFAFGSAYPNTIINGLHMNKEELDRVGCNICPEHMDFTIGTKDLVIVAKTYKNEEIVLFTDGNFNYNLIQEISPFI